MTSRAFHKIMYLFKCFVLLVMLRMVKLKVRNAYPCVQCGHMFSYGDVVNCKLKTITCPICGVEAPVYVSSTL